MRYRYFAGTAMGGRLFVRGMADGGPWDPAHLIYWDEEGVDKIYQPLAGDRKVHTAEEILKALQDSRASIPSIKLLDA